MVFTQMGKARVMKLQINQSGPYETDPQEWSLTRLQRCINEDEHLLSDMQTYTDSEVSALRVFVERELGRKKNLLTHIWTQYTSQR